MDEGIQLELFPGASFLKTRSHGEEPIPVEEGEESVKQLDLFSDRNVLLTEIECAISDARFDEALRLLDKLREDYGFSSSNSDLDFLDDLTGLFYNLHSSLQTWIDTKTRLPDSRRRQVTLAFFIRLLSHWQPEEIFQKDASCLSDLVNALIHSGLQEKARSLVRDALLQGIEVPPKQIYDPEISDLLTEDAKPQCLACIGALKKLWSVPRAGEDEIRSVQAMVTGPLLLQTETEKAQAFWMCLRVAQIRPIIPAVYTARKLMKLLNPEWHATYMSAMELV